MVVVIYLVRFVLFDRNLPLFNSFRHLFGYLVVVYSYMDIVT